MHLWPTGRFASVVRAVGVSQAERPSSSTIGVWRVAAMRAMATQTD
jgi:hypothetical protein